MLMKLTPVVDCRLQRGQRRAVLFGVCLAAGSLSSKFSTIGKKNSV
jgi:hypothetical protein